MSNFFLRVTFFSLQQCNKNNLQDKVKINKNEEGKKVNKDLILSKYLL